MDVDTVLKGDILSWRIEFYCKQTCSLGILDNLLLSALVIFSFVLIRQQKLYF